MKPNCKYTTIIEKYYYYNCDLLSSSMISFSNITSADSDGRTCGLVSLHCLPTKFMGLFPRVLPIVEMMTPRENTSLEMLTGFPCNTSEAI
jgi:hypothetical protein